MGWTFPAIRVTDDNDDIIIKIDKCMLLKEFENHPEFIYEHASEELFQQVKINNIHSFFEKIKQALVYGVNGFGNDTTLTEEFIEKVFLWIWDCGEADFIEECDQDGWVSKEDNLIELVK